MDEQIKLIPSEVAPQEDNEESYVHFVEEAQEPRSTLMAAVSYYTLRVDTNNQVVSAYENGKTLCRQMVCSTGKNETPTPLGTFKTSSQYRWGYFDKFDCWAQYWTRFNGPYLFHSVLYKKKDESTLNQSSVNNLGSKASHGCVRLRVVDAQWIYEHCKSGTEVKVVADPVDALFAAAVKKAGALTGSALYKKEDLPAIGTGKVATSGGKLNMRSQPSTSSAVIGTLSNGTSLDILRYEGDWVLVRAGADVGYVSKEFVRVEGVTPPPDPTPGDVIATGKVKTAGGSLNLRSAASSGASIVKTLANGTALDILRDAGDWYQVRAGSSVGYVSKQYVSVDGGSTPVTPPSDGNKPIATARVKTAGGTLNMRAAASTGASVLTALSNGTTLDVYAYQGDWAKIVYKGATGYVSLQYIEVLSGTKP